MSAWAALLDSEPDVVDGDAGAPTAWDAMLVDSSAFEQDADEGAVDDSAWVVFLGDDVASDASEGVEEPPGSPPSAEGAVEPGAIDVHPPLGEQVGGAEEMAFVLRETPAQALVATELPGVPPVAQVSRLLRKDCGRDALGLALGAIVIALRSGDKTARGKRELRQDPRSMSMLNQVGEATSHMSLSCLGQLHGLYRKQVHSKLVRYYAAMFHLWQQQALRALWGL